MKSKKLLGSLKCSCLGTVKGNQYVLTTPFGISWDPFACFLQGSGSLLDSMRSLTGFHFFTSDVSGDSQTPQWEEHTSRWFEVCCLIHGEALQSRVRLHVVLRVLKGLPVAVISRHLRYG